jgi:acetyltransferase-like isoleucine patch superfamily enzyme
MTPLSRPPLGPHAGDKDPPSSRQDGLSATTRVGVLERLRAELLAALPEIDPGRVVWQASRVVPDFTFGLARARLLAMLGCDIRRGTAVLGHVNIVGPRNATANLRVGPGCVIAPGVTLCLNAPITLGRNVSLGPRVMLYTATHPLGSGSRRMHLDTSAHPIVVEDGAWIGLGAIVLSGVRIGRGAVVGAGSVVTRDVPDNTLVAGNPATIVETLPAR